MHCKCVMFGLSFLSFTELLVSRSIINQIPFSTFSIPKSRKATTVLSPQNGTTCYARTVTICTFMGRVIGRIWRMPQMVESPEIIRINQGLKTYFWDNKALFQ